MKVFTNSILAGLSFVLLIHIALAKAPPAQFVAIVKDLNTEVSTLNKLIAQAKECFPTISKNSSKFCTGFELSNTEAERLVALSLDQCEAEIRAKGYTPYIDETPKELSTKDYAEFSASTKRAQTYHNEKVVLFKKPIENLTCTHELLHLYQRSVGAKGPLAPKNREIARDRIIAKLNQAVPFVETTEKSGDKTTAQEMASQLKPVMSAMQSWTSLNDVLDEKDVHGWLWLWCREHVKATTCSLSQKDMALANLWIRRDFIPIRRVEEIKVDTAKLLPQLKGH